MTLLIAGSALGQESPSAPPVVLEASIQPQPRLLLQSGDLSMWLEASAQLRPRAEVIAPRDLSGDAPITPITQRARVGLGAGALDHLTLRFELQDVRAWGSERPLGAATADPTLFGYSAAGLDMHQAWATLHGEHLWLRIGRQEIVLDSQRLVGAVDWTQQARSFDAVRAGYQRGDFNGTLFAALARSVDVSAPSDPPLPEQWLAGAHLAWQVVDAVRLAPLVLLDSDDVLPRLRWTTGVRVDGGALGFLYDVEAYYQGAQAPLGITSAFLLGVRAGYRFDIVLQPQLTLFTDVLSGDTSPDDAAGLSSFDTLYATNHKFYGYQDLFLNLPLHTREQGLVDAGASLRLGGQSLYAEAVLHVFTASAPVGESALFGLEPDVVLGYKIWRGVSVEGGASLFVPIGDGLGRGDALTPWAYLQLNAQL